VLLAIARKALPALPISIFLGIMFFLLSKLVLVPYVNTLNSQAIFV
jgi:presenilin 1